MITDKLSENLVVRKMKKMNNTTEKSCTTFLVEMVTVQNFTHKFKVLMFRYVT